MTRRNLVSLLVAAGLCCALSGQSQAAPDFSQLRRAAVWRLDAPATAIVFSPDNKMLAAGSVKGITVFDTKGKVVHTLHLADEPAAEKDKRHPRPEMMPPAAH